MPTQPQLSAATTASDYELFKSLLLEYAQRDLDDPKNSTIWADIEQLPGRYHPPHGHVLLARSGDQLAACAGLAPTQHPGIAEIKRVYVRAGFRRQGLARILTHALLSQAQHMGYRSAAISTWPHNTQAIALYQQLGFEPVAPFKTHTHAELVFLGLPLTPCALAPTV